MSVDIYTLVFYTKVKEKPPILIFFCFNRMTNQAVFIYIKNTNIFGYFYNTKKRLLPFDTAVFFNHSFFSLLMTCWLKKMLKLLLHTSAGGGTYKEDLTIFL